MTCRFQTSPAEIPAGSFVKIGNMNLNFICTCKEPRIDQTNLKKKNKFGQLAVPFSRSVIIDLESNSSQDSLVSTQN